MTGVISCKAGPMGASITAKRAAKRKSKLQRDVENLYAEVVEGETVLTLRLPNWRSAEGMIESGLAAMVIISRQDKDPEIAYKAAGFLVEYGTRQLERGGKLLDSGGVMAQLEGLYRKALPVEAEVAEPLVVEEGEK